MNEHSDVENFARNVRGLPRAWRNFSTAIGDALLKAGNSFADVPYCKRRVIDVSGDGKSNEGFEVEAARTALIARGIVINGLAIEGSEQDLRTYFKNSVIGGHGAFALSAEGYSDYPRAIRRKLLEEITKPVG